MNQKYKNLVTDTINFIKKNEPLFFEEDFLMQIKPVKNKPIFKEINKKTSSLPLKVKIKEAPPKKISEKPPTEPPKIASITSTKKSYIDTSYKLQANIDLFTDISKAIKNIDPNYQLREKTLDDNKAKKIASKWKSKLNEYPVTILTTSKNENEINFLKSIAMAIEIYFYEAKVVFFDRIDKENQWDEFLKSKNIRLIISIDDQIWEFKNLIKHFKEVPNQSLKMLGDIPIFLIPNLKLYFQNFKLKKSLWNALCQTIKAL